MLIWAIGSLKFTGWGQGKFSGMWCEPIAALVWTPLHCVHKNTPGALKRCSCSVETKKENKGTFKVEKTPSDLNETQSNKPNLSLPTVLLQDKSFCSAVPNSSLLAEPHAGSLSSSQLRFARFSAPFWQLQHCSCYRLPGSVAQQGNSLILGKDRAPSIWWGIPEQELLARTLQPHKPLQPNTCN